MKKRKEVKDKKEVSDSYQEEVDMPSLCSVVIY